MEIRQLFPLGKAYGDAFCNRTEETESLAGNIRSVKHTLLIAPRRYGKSSLAEKAIEKIGIPSMQVNFHLCTSEKEVAQLILESTIKLIGKSIGKFDKLIISIKKYISNLEPSLSFNDKTINLKLTPKDEANHAVSIAEALLLLEKLLVEKKKKAAFFFDEFQEISRIDKHKTLEGAIRAAAQETKNLSFVFSGSIRSLLLSMFEDENRPLYKLCRKIKLERISAAHYEKHIQRIAQLTWKKHLNSDVFDKIMELSNQHPYYVNYLCDSLWESCKKLPVIEDVQQAWEKVVMEEWSDALKELSDLPMGQRRLLKYIASHPVKNIQSQGVCHQLSMPASSIASSINTLLDKDYIEQDANGEYKIINPLLLAVLNGAGMI